MTPTLPVTTLSTLAGRPVARDLGVVFGYGDSAFGTAPEEAALESLQEQARGRGAEAVLGLRMSLAGGDYGTTYIAYGTAATLGLAPG